MSEDETCFRTYPDAPARIAANSASSSAYEVRMRQATAGHADADVSADLDAAAVGQPNVQNGHVGSDGGNPVEGLGAGGRLPHHP